MPLIDIVLDANIPKKVKKMNGGNRVLHIGDIDTRLSDRNILQIAKSLGGLIVTHDRELALQASKGYKTLFIRDPIDAKDIIQCIEKNEKLLKTASIFCENGIKCENCRS